MQQVQTIWDMSSLTIIINYVLNKMIHHIMWQVKIEFETNKNK